MLPTEEPSNPGPRLSSEAKFLATVNCVLGGLHLISAGFLLASHLFFSAMDLPFQLYTEMGQKPDADTPFAASAQAAILYATLQLVMSVPMIASGVGLFTQRRWSITLVKAVAIASGLLAIVSLFLMKISGAFWFAGYAIFVFVVLPQIQITFDSQRQNH